MRPPRSAPTGVRQPERVRGRFSSARVLLNAFYTGFQVYSCLHETRLETQQVQRHGAGFSVLSANRPCVKAERVVSLLGPLVVSEIAFL